MESIIEHVNKNQKRRKHQHCDGKDGILHPDRHNNILIKDCYNNVDQNGCKNARNQIQENNILFDIEKVNKKRKMLKSYKEGLEMKNFEATIKSSVKNEMIKIFEYQENVKVKKTKSKKIKENLYGTSNYDLQCKINKTMGESYIGKMESKEKSKINKHKGTGTDVEITFRNLTNTNKEKKWKHSNKSLFDENEGGVQNEEISLNTGKEEKKLKKDKKTTTDQAEGIVKNIVSEDRENLKIIKVKNSKLKEIKDHIGNKTLKFELIDTQKKKWNERSTGKINEELLISKKKKRRKNNSDCTINAESEDLDKLNRNKNETLTLNSSNTSIKFCSESNSKKNISTKRKHSEDKIQKQTESCQVPVKRRKTTESNLSLQSPNPNIPDCDLMLNVVNIPVIKPEKTHQKTNYHRGMYQEKRYQEQNSSRHDRFTTRTSFQPQIHTDIMVGEVREMAENHHSVPQGVKLSFKHAHFQKNSWPAKWDLNTGNPSKKSYKHLIRGDVIVTFKNTNLHEITGYGTKMMKIRNC